MRKKKNAPSAGAYELALAAVSNEEPELEKAKSLLEEAHSNGDPRATYALATWYLFGYGGFVLDKKRAVVLLKEAANSNISLAHFDLAVCYEVGSGVRKNSRLAYRHFLAAALNGDVDAFSEVGRCHYYGIGVIRDRKVARIWFERASALGANVR